MTEQLQRLIDLGKNFFSPTSIHIKGASIGIAVLGLVVVSL